MGEKKVAKPARKPAAKSAAAKKTVKAKAPAKTTVKKAKSVASGRTVKAKSTKPSVLNIADHAVRKVSENIGHNLKKSEHWHTVFFAILVIAAAYFSYYATLQDDEPQPVATTNEEEEAVVPPVEEEEEDETVVEFNFPNDYAWLTQDLSPDVTVAAGEAVSFEIVIKNSGKATWYRDSAAAFRMGTLRPTDSIVPFMASSVIGENQTRLLPNKNRLEMMQAQVAPGETANFKIEGRAVDWNNLPLKPGRYAFTVGFMVEGKGSLSKQPLTWVLNVR